MAIKDQCENCRKKGTVECTENPIYDGLSCSSYSKGINLEKDENTNNVIENKFNIPTEDTESSEAFVYTSDYLKENTNIHGWLSFFLFAITLGGIFSVVYPIATFNPSEYGGSNILALGDVFLGIMLFGVAVYTVYSFIQRKPNAVFLGKTYVIAVFATNLLSLLGGDFATSGFGSLPQIFRSLVWAIIWFSYLCLSNQVQEVIPIEYRKLRNSDYYLVVAMIILPLAFIGWGVKDALSSHEEETATFLQNVVLNEGEYTDGNVVFASPVGFTCEEQEVDGIKIFNLECESVGSITICSDYETDRSEQNVRSYWENWEDDDAKNTPSELDSFETHDVNGHPYYYIVKKYTIDESELFWRFIMMFDIDEGKACVISCYDGGYDEYIEELLNSIRFK